MDENGAIPIPKNLEEVEDLVKRLYLPGKPSVVTAIDNQLKLLQHSSEGWQLADGLLASRDQNVRFFAALTFQIKLNSDGAKLDATSAEAVLMKLVSWTVRLDAAGEGHMVRKKLCGALGTYFLRGRVAWQRPLLHMVASFQQSNAIPEDQLPASHDAIDQFLPSLNDSQLVTMLWLAGQLATDATKTDSTSPASARVHNQMESLVQDTSALIHHALSQPFERNAGRVKAESLACFLNWVNYAQPMWPTKPEALNSLRRLVEPLAALLTDPSLQAEAMDVFRDILESYTSFFQPPHMQTLSVIIQQHVQSRLLQGLRDMEPEVLPVAQLVIAYGIANVQQIVENPSDDGSAITLQLILSILRAPGYPGDEDEVSINSIEFWNTYIEYINEVTYSNTSNDSQQPWVGQAKETCSTLTHLLWQKMKTPDTQIAKDWTEAESEGFKEFRMDASDLMLSVYIFLGSGMLEQLVNLVMNSIQTQNWQDMEAALFCMNTLADNVLEDQTAENLLLPVFRSPLYRIVGDFNIAMPTQARRTAVDTLGAYGQYIERHAEFLPDTLRFLFASLETQGLCLSAAKSIASLCSTCRSSLTGELDGFLAQYNRFAQSDTSEPYTNEKVIGAIAAIIQAVTPESAKVAPLSALLDIIDGMITNARQLVEQQNLDSAVLIGTGAIDCLATAGKNLQTEDDIPIDLYEDSPQSKDQNNYWQTSEGQEIQSRIVNLCQTARELLPGSGEVVEGICKVLRSGFAETEPGPFVFPPSHAVAFLQTCQPSTPNIESVLSMICTLVVQYSRKDQPQIDPEISQVYETIVTFIQHISPPDEPIQDPGVAQGCIDILNKMNPRYMHILLNIQGSEQPVEMIFNMALKSLDGFELMSKRAAADFWSHIVKPISSPKPEARPRLEQVVAGYGPALVQALINQITIRGQRSELEQLCEPLKAVVSTQSLSRTWLEAALSKVTPSNASGPTVDEGEKSRFISQLLATRGDTRRTREVVKNFFAACRGTVVSYS